MPDVLPALNLPYFWAWEPPQNKGTTTVLKLGGPTAEGASHVEAPKAPRGVACGEGVSPSPLGERSGKGAVPPPQNFFLNFGSQNGELSCILGGIF